MKLLVLGATGGIGLEIVRQALERGHSVTAFVRSADGLKKFKDSITIIQGDLLDSKELERVIDGQDAVLSAFGARVPVSKADSKLLSEFARALTAAMQRTSVKRVVVVSTAFLFKDAIFPPAYLFGRLFFANTVIDATEMEAIFLKSNLQWTIVRPPQLTYKAQTGKYRILEGHLPNFGFNISRADVAHCMIKIAENRTCIGKIVGIAN